MFEKKTVLSFNSQEDLDYNAAQFIVERAKAAIREKGSFSLVLSGGTTPINVYKLLAKEQVDFEKWYIYFGDERCFPLNHLERNSNVIDAIFFAFCLKTSSSIDMSLLLKLFSNSSIELFTASSK